MNLTQSTNSQYEAGTATAHDAVVKLMTKIEPTGSMSQLDGLSTSLIPALAKYAQAFAEGRRSTAERIPTVAQAELAKAWLANGKFIQNNLGEIDEP